MSSSRQQNQGLTQLLGSFRRTKNPIFLLRAGGLALREGRLREILGSALSEILLSPAPVSGEVPTLGIRQIFSRTDPNLGITLDLRRLAEIFGDGYHIAGMPPDFQGTRWSCVCRCGGELLIGEYQEGKRLFRVGPRSVSVSGHYDSQRDVRHIHSVIKLRGGG